MATKRVLYIDYAKGIAILLMLLQHSIPQHNFLRQIIQSFVMPFFFVAGGFIWNLKMVSGNEIGLSREYFKKRLKRLAIPYLLAGSVLILFYGLLSFISGGHSVLHNLIRLISLQGIDSLWFLPVYFCSEVLFLWVISFKDKRYQLSLIVAVPLLLMFFVKYDAFPWPYGLFESSLIGLVFFYIGYSSSRYRLEDLNPIIVVLFCFLGLIGSYYNGFASFAELNSPILFCLIGSILSIVLLTVCKWIECSGFQATKFLSFLGRETLFILCTNNLIIESVRLMDHRVSNDWLLNHGMLGNFVMFLIISLLEALLIRSFRSVRCLFYEK